MTVTRQNQKALLRKFRQFLLHNLRLFQDPNYICAILFVEDIEPIELVKMEWIIASAFPLLREVTRGIIPPCNNI